MIAVDYLGRVGVEMVLEGQPTRKEVEGSPRCSTAGQNQVSRLWHLPLANNASTRTEYWVTTCLGRYQGLGDQVPG